MSITTSDVPIKCVEGFIRHNLNTISMKKCKVLKIKVFSTSVGH